VTRLIVAVRALTGRGLVRVDEAAFRQLSTIERKHPPFVG